MFGIIILVTCSLALVGAVTFTDCATNRSNTVLTMHQIDFSPYTVTFPGDLHVTLKLTINRPIPRLFVDVVLEKYTLGIWTKVPCIGNILFGSCQKIDVCSILETLQNGSSILSTELGQQIDAMLASGLGYKARCPISFGSLYINDYLIRLNPLHSVLSSLSLSSGKWRIQISVKEDLTMTDNLGCIRFDVQTREPTPGVSSAIDKSYTVLTVHKLELSPFIVTFPGDMYVTLNVTINKLISHLFVDVVIEIKTLGIWTKIPCIDNILFGSCTNIDVCSILDTIPSGSSVLSKELWQQIDAMLLSGLGQKARCPISPGSLYINDYLLRLQPIPRRLGLFLTTAYQSRVRISVKDDPTSIDNLAFIEFMAQLGGVSHRTTPVPTVPQPGVG